jgi:hypothetical protein
MYADGAFLRTELGHTFVQAFFALANVPAARAKCIQQAANGIEDLVAGVGGKGSGLAVGQYGGHFDAAACLTLEGAQHTTVDGAEAFDLGNEVYVLQPGILLVGSRASVERAVKAHPAAFPPELSLGPDEYVALSVWGDGEKVSGTLLASKDRFRIGVEADVPDTIAEGLEREIQGRKTQLSQTLGLTGEQAELLDRLARAFEVTRQGNHLQGAFELVEPVVDQARDLGAAGALGLAALRRYLAEAKTAEARNTVGAIAKGYAAWYSREDPRVPKSRRKLFSLPAVPNFVPRAQKYQSSPVDWQPWERIEFSMDAPQYYQYEVRAAKDGNSADIFAHGDLDGDGKESEFRLHIAVDPKRGVLVIDPQITERDPLF